MGGLWRRLPGPFAGMLVGAMALAALPLTSGYFSKDAILLTSYDAPGGPWLWAVATLAALVTALYSARLVFVVFFGEPRWKGDPRWGAGHEPHDASGWNMHLPLLVLGVLAVAGGWFGLAPPGAVLPDGGIHGEHGGWVVWVTSTVPVLGVGLGYLLFQRWRTATERLTRSSAAAALGRFWLAGWGFDWLYARLLERPFTALARFNRNDVVDRLFDAVAAVTRGAHQLAVGGQTGHLRWYLANMAAGLALLLIIVLGAL
jgi:NADH-quinone oxidoreductase subunit L